MTRLQISTRLLAAAFAAGLVPGFAWADDEAATKKEIPGGRQRLAPRPSPDGPALSGIPTGDNTMPPPSMHGFGPMSGNPLIATPPVKAAN